MKTRALFIVTAVFFIHLSGVGLAIENAVGPATMPASTFRSGLVRSPNPIDTSSNLMITGNVSGGKHFRGIVPYNAISDFGGRLNTGTLDSFLRYSAGSNETWRLPGRFTPFYSQTGTVTTTIPEGRVVVRPPTTRIDDRAEEGFDLEHFGRVGVRGLPSTDSALLNIRLRPMSRARQELERTISTEIGRYTQGRRLAEMLQDARIGKSPEELLQGEVVIEDVVESPSLLERHQMKQLRQELIQDLLELEEERRREPAELQGRVVPVERVLKRKKGGELLSSRRLTSQDKSLWFRSREISKTDRQQVGEPILRGRLRKEGKTETQFIPEKAGRVRSRAPTETPELGGGTSQRARPGEADLRKLDEIKVVDSDVYEKMKQQLGSLREDSYDSYGADSKSPLVDSESIGGIETMSYKQKAKAILGAHRTFASFADDKFNQHIREGEAYVKQGEYYRAADAYTLASVYRPESPLAYAGKSHALFAAGEYMSSALFLSRALEIFPEYEKKLKGENEGAETELANLAVLASSLKVIDRDKLEDRVVDIEQWQEKSDSAELQFLLGYIYYQIGRLDVAREAIEKAYEKMPDAPAVITLKKVIDSSQVSEGAGVGPQLRKDAAGKPANNK